MGIVALFAVLFVAPPAEPAHQGRPLSAWVRDLSSADENEVSRAIGALVALGPAARPAVPALIEVAFDGNRDRLLVRQIARMAIGKIGLPAVGELTTRLRAARERGSLEERFLLVRMLYLHGAAAAPAKALLIEELKQDLPRRANAPPMKDQCRMVATAVLAQIGPAVLPDLMTAGARSLESPRSDDHLALVGPVALLGESATPTLTKALEGGRREEKLFAAWGLLRLGTHGAAALEALRAAEKSSDEELSRVARTAREEIEGQVYSGRLVGLIGTGNAGALPAVAMAAVIPPRSPERPPSELHALPPSPVLSVPAGWPGGKWLLLAAAGLVLGVWIVHRLFRPKGPFPAPDKPT